MALFSTSALSLMGASTAAGKSIRMGAGNSETEHSPSPEGKCPCVGALLWQRCRLYIKWGSSKTLNLKRYMHPYVNNSTMYNSQDMETTCMPTDRWMDKEDMVRVCNGILLLLLSHFSRVRLCATHGLQPTRHLCPWDSPGKNTGVGCHFLLQYMKVESESEVAQSCLTLSDPMDCSLPGSSIHGIFRATVLEWGAIAFFKQQWNTTQPPKRMKWCHLQQHG